MNTSAVSPGRAGLFLLLTGQMLPLIDRVLVLSCGKIAYFGDKEEFLRAAEGVGVNQLMHNIIHGEAT